MRDTNCTNLLELSVRPQITQMGTDSDLGTTKHTKNTK